MLVIIIVLFNLVIVLVNFVLVWQVISWKNYLVKLNAKLISIEVNLKVSLKKIPLTILLAALEIRKSKEKYQLLQTKRKKLGKLIIVTRYVYKIYQRKFL